MDPYDFNCAHCVQAYEQRRRGLPVQASAVPVEFLPGFAGAGGRTLRDLRRVWDVAFEAASPQRITEVLTEGGSGARAFVAVLWRFGGGHLFNAENAGGQVRFVDPQTGDPDVRRYFASARWSAYARVDQVTPGSGVREFTVTEPA